MHWYSTDWEENLLKRKQHRKIRAHRPACSGLIRDETGDPLNGSLFLCYNILIHNGKMHFYSVEYWQKNWETLVERVENGETIGVENDNGERAVMVPADDELIRIYTEQNNEGS